MSGYFFEDDQLEPILQLRNITKEFPGVRALDDVSLEVRKSEVHGLVGENGAGKSTLMHILAGVFPPDQGEIRLTGSPLTIEDERHAQQLGIGMVFQERSLVVGLSIAENIFAGRQPTNRFGMVDRKRMNSQAADLLRRVGLTIDPSLKVARLTSIQKQLVEIAKALSLDAKVLILDEPTATITERETEILFALICELKERGMSVIYISHRLQELSSICDRVSILKDGVYQGTRDMDKVTIDEIVTMMVGRKIVNQYEGRGGTGEEKILEVRELSSTAFTDISFSLHRGEILGIAGLAGAGRTETALALFGYDPEAEGDIILDGISRRFRSPKDAIHSGIGYLTEDRKEAGLFLEMDVAANIVSASLDSFSPTGIMNDRLIEKRCSESVKQLNVRTTSLAKQALHLSGGNQQKLLLARWMMKQLKVLIVDEPTRGVDVGAKNEIYDLIRKIASDGAGVILISSELPEVLTLCDRIIVMYQGRITGELTQDEATEEKIMHLLAGLTKRGEAAL